MKISIGSERHEKLRLSVVLLAGALLLASGVPGVFAGDDSPAFLGVSIQAISHADKKEMGISHGVRVLEVQADSPAEKAGIQVQDIILKLDNTEILTPEDLIQAVKSHQPGDRVNLTIRRGKKLQPVIAHLAAMNPEKLEKRARQWKGLIQSEQPWLGIVPFGMNRHLSAYFGVTPEKGVLVLEVEKDGPAAKGGMLSGDIISQVDGERVRNPRDIRRIVSQLKPGESVTLKLIRKGKPMTLNLTVGKHRGLPGMNLQLFREGKGDEGGIFLDPGSRGILKFRGFFPDSDNEDVWSWKLPSDKNARILLRRRGTTSI